MDSLILLIISILALAGLIKWRIMVAEKRLEGKPVSIGNDTDHPEGMLYYFYHPRCGPCRSMTPAIEELMARNPGRIEKINIADNREMTQSMGIRATPTTVLVKDNRIIKAFIGARSVKALETLLPPGGH